MHRLSLQPAMTTEEFRLINELITELLGIQYPEKNLRILENKLRPRLRELELDRFMDYYLLLQYDLDRELDRLTRLVTNNETYFFRETHQFEALLEEAFDDLHARAARPGQLRVLCAGCSSGEEPYTLSIYFRFHPLRALATRLVLDAFDVDSDRVAMARRAEYGPNSLRATEEELIRTCFRRSGTDRYALNDRFRRGVEFHHGNIVDRFSYPSVEPYDVVFCRNVLIYFSEPALHRAIDNFALTLRSGGILFLGHAESIIGMSPDFETLRLSRCIAYRRV